MSLNTILATTPNTTSGYVLRATGTTIGNSTIQDDGTNVAIGTTPGTYKFNVSGTGNFTGALTGTSATFSSSVTINSKTILGSDGTIKWGNSSGDAGDLTWDNDRAIIVARSGKLLALGANGSQNMYISTSGNVGIGTSSPSDLLFVVGSGLYPRITIQSTNAGSSSAGLNFADNSGTQWAIAYDKAGGGLQFFKEGSGNRMYITNSGNVGIGTSSPQDKLDVNGSIRFRGNTPNFTAVTDNGVIDYVPTSIFSTDPCIRIAAIGTSSVGAEIRFQTGTSTTNAERMRITSGGIIQVATDGVLQVPFSSTTSITNVSGISLQSRYSTTYLQSWNAAVNAYAGIYINSSFIGTSSLGTGTVYSNSGALTNTNPSDERLKDNINDICWGLNEILKLRPVEYTWKDDRTNQGKQYGFIAQEVQPIIPELVKEFTIPANEELGTEELVRLGLEKDGIFVSLVKAIQEQQAQIEAQQQQINSLINR